MTARRVVMTEPTESASLQEQVDRLLPVLQAMTVDELEAYVGEIPLGSRLYDANERLKLPDIRAAGRRFLQTNQRLRQVVCEARNKKLISDQLTTGNVTTIVNALLPVFGIAAGAVLPLSIVALAVLLLKIGLNVYCRDVNSG
jgi:hypothetical protein